MDHEVVDVSQLRAPYHRDTFTEDQLASNNDPFVQFHSWFQEALSCDLVSEPHSMCLSTSTKDGKPSNRMVLMKMYDQGGLTFFTNYKSRKGRELEENPNACALFYWVPLHRQIKVEGKVIKLPEEDSTRYFNSRPRISQASASASLQSSVITSREELEERQQAVLQKYPEGVAIPRPENWGGYVLLPSLFEFWQGQSSRLHDRIVFTKDEQTGEWEQIRLAP